MSEIWNLSELCRCCHADGNFKSLQMPYRHGDTMEVYSNMLRECLGISIVPPSIEASYSICDKCIEKLRDSNNFRKQVLECEQKFLIYCQNETAIIPNVAIKLEPDVSDNEYKNDDKLTIEIEKKCDPDSNDDEGGYCHQDIKADPDSEVKLEDVESKSTIKKVKSSAKAVTARTRWKKGNHFCCAVCNGVFNKKIEVNRHVKELHQPPIGCTECSKDYNSYQEFKQHVKSGCHRKFQCKFCRNIYKTYSAVMIHENCVHLNKSCFKCDICGKNFGYKSALRKHILFHLGLQKTCICDLCGHRFNDRSNLKIHVMNVHQKIRRFACDRCDKKFSLKKHLLRHFIRHDGVRSEHCPSCSRNFFDKEDLRYHLRNVHDIDPGQLGSGKVAVQAKVYKCTVCEGTFNIRGLYMKHLKKHRENGALPYTCEVCGKNFKGRYVLNRHVSSHTSNDLKFKFPCPVCQKRFTTKASMERHAKQIHDPERDKYERVKCPTCKVYVKDLHKHQKKHIVRPHACSLCPKTYPERNALNRHVKLAHLLLRQHPCELCGKAYSRADVLKKHMEIKHLSHKGRVKVKPQSTVSQLLETPLSLP